MITVALVESQALIREALRTLLNAGSGITVVADTPTAADMLPVLQRSPSHVVVLSLERGVGDPDAVLGALVNQASRSCRALVLTDDSDPERDVHLIRLGARGMVRRDQSGAVLRHAISAVHAGDLWVDRSRLTTLIGRGKRGGWNETDGETARVQSLTAREREVITLVADGLNNTRIAERLVISADTVRNHVSSILSKLELIDRFQLAVYAFRRGLVLCPPTTAMLHMFSLMSERQLRRDGRHVGQRRHER